MNLSRTRQPLCVAAWVLSGFLLLMGARNACGVDYPDVWDWRPRTPATDLAHVEFRRMPDGDVLLSYYLGYATARPLRDVEILTFFGRHRFQSNEEAFGVAPGALHPAPEHAYPARLPNGKLVTALADSDCSRGVGSRITVRDGGGQPIVETSFLILLDRPRQSPPVVCEEKKRPGFRFTVGVFQPRTALPLADNTFLVPDSLTGTVLRFDDTLHTKSPLLGTRVVSVDSKELEQLVRRYYRPAPEYGVYWARYFDDLRSRFPSTMK